MADSRKIVCLDAASMYPADDPKWGAFTEYGEFEVYDRTEPSQVVERGTGAEILLTNKVALDGNIFRQLPDLKYVCVLATGYNIIDIRTAAELGIKVSNIPSYSTASVAQQAIALLLAMTNRVEHYAVMDRQGKWTSNPDFSYRLFSHPELDGKNFGVVGFGHTGSRTAAIAAALGMNILVYTSKDQKDLPEGYRKVTMDELFRESDVVSLHCPLTDSTRNLVNAERLHMMKPTAYLINTSRGPVVNEHDLAEALKEGVIAGAGLDVLCSEPPKPDNELLPLPNCFVTPHIAWASNEARQRLFNIALDNVKSFVDGQPINLVN